MVTFDLVWCVMATTESIFTESMTVRFSKPDLTALEDVAKRRRCSVVDVVRCAVGELIEREKNLGVTG